MTVDIADLLSAPRNLTDELFARPEHLKVFVSSQMRGLSGAKVFEVERVTAAQTIDATAIARAWCWERDAQAGPYCSERVCVAHAATSDGLVLLVGETLTGITRKEYEVAHGRNVPCYVFVDQRVVQDDVAKQFIHDVRNSDVAITKGFGNVAELEGHITDALRHFTVQAVRRINYAAWEQRQGGVAQ